MAITGPLRDSDLEESLQLAFHSAETALVKKFMMTLFL